MLVIIGLIVGGVLVGQDLISGAAMRAQISQIERYNTAANTFYGKYGYLPGDIPAGPAAQFGFVARGAYAGEGDGNGVIEGATANAPSSNSGFSPATGEAVTFWVDLSQAGLIEGGFNTATPNNPIYAVYPNSTPGFSAYLPVAKLGQGNYIYVWSGGAGERFGHPNGRNYFGLSKITGMNGSAISSGNGITVAQASAIDTKVDDGFPQTGRVTAELLNGTYANWSSGYTDQGVPTTYAGLPPSPATCFDNGGVSGNVPMLYSLAENNGNGVNCALSFQMQGAAR